MNRPPLALAPLWLLVGCIETGISPPPEYPDVGAAPPVEDVLQVDEIVQVTTPMVDILWTIDNSCSMAPEQEALRDNFPAFMAYFLDSGLDYHIGVTSTDIDTNCNGCGGKLVTAAGANFIDNETLDPMNVFGQMAVLGTGGWSNEKGLGATFKALESNRDTTNAGFYRDEAAIHTIVISDEPDGTQGSLITQPEFVTWYDGLKPDVDMRSFSSIVDTVGTKYKNSSIAIGGIVWDITSDDWPQLLERLGVQAAGLKREYFLSQLPAPGTLTVEVHDAESGATLDFVLAIVDPVTGLPGEGDYLYDPNRNSIVFLEYIPNPLSTIVLTYTLLASQQVQTEVLPE